MQTLRITKSVVRVMSSIALGYLASPANRARAKSLARKLLTLLSSSSGIGGGQ